MVARNLSCYRPFFVCGAILLISLQLAIVGLGLPHGLAGRADFRMLYSGGWLIRTGHGNQIYDDNQTAATEAELAGKTGADLPFNHPAYEGLLFALLSFLSYKKAYWFFFFANIILLSTAIWMLRPPPRWMGEIVAGLPIMVAAGFIPVGICLFQGQDSILFFFLLVASYAFQKSGREFAAGMVLGLAMFRFQLVIPMAVLLFFSRRWKLLAGFAVMCTAVGAASIATTEPASWLAYPRYLMAMNSGLEAQTLAHGIHPTLMPNFRGLIQLLLGTRVSGIVLQTLTVMASMTLLVWAILIRLPYERMVIVAVLVSYHGLIHDSVILLLPLLTCGIDPALGSGKRLLIWSLLAVSPLLLFVMPMPPALLSLVSLAYLVLMKVNGETLRLGGQPGIVTPQRLPGADLTR